MCRPPSDWMSSMRKLMLLICAVALAAATAQAAPAFQPQSVTFVSLRQGWALGTAGGSLALRETTDGGRSWTVRPVPHIAGRHALNVRFADPRDGWIFGGALLWSTHDGGRSWRRLVLHGLGLERSVYDLEASRGTAWLAASNTHEGVEHPCDRGRRRRLARGQRAADGIPRRWRPAWRQLHVRQAAPAGSSRATTAARPAARASRVGAGCAGRRRAPPSATASRSRRRPTRATSPRSA